MPAMSRKSNKKCAHTVHADAMAASIARGASTEVTQSAAELDATIAELVAAQHDPTVTITDRAAYAASLERLRGLHAQAVEQARSLARLGGQ
ncbi:hypothetical protein GCM10023147_26380 [Tsukamurella soli]|uniref:Uncharacterized protein n=2 Tax=Tsukamurella soli TaxID=644556 RepID=A0ABP8JQ62_9ACTN